MGSGADNVRICEVQQGLLYLRRGMGHTHDIRDPLSGMSLQGGFGGPYGNIARINLEGLVIAFLRVL